MTVALFGARPRLASKKKNVPHLQKIHVPPLAKKRLGRALKGEEPRIARSTMGHFYWTLLPLNSACRDGSNDAIHVNRRHR